MNTQNTKLTPRERKKKRLEEYKKWLEQSNTVILLETTMPAIEVWSLKKELKEKQADYHVVKNRLFSMALENIYGEKPDINGFTAAVFCKDDPIIPAKSIVKLVNEKKASLKFGYCGKKQIDQEDIKKLANVAASYKELIGKLIYAIEYPLVSFSYIIQSPLQRFIFSLNKIKENKSLK